MSHEIRTPLNGIIGLSRLASQSEQANEVRDYLRKIVLSGKSLLQIINDILDISKIEANKIHIEDSAFKLSEVIESISASMANLAKEKGLFFFIVTPPTLPDKIRGDSTRLYQIITNLCSNAIKFTEQGYVKIIIDVNEVDGQTRLNTKVEDTGIGLSPAEQDRIFTEFVQADNSTTRRFGGTGLGLSITNNLISLMKGRLSVSSAPKQGSCFSFWIPIEIPNPSTKSLSQINKDVLRKVQLQLILEDEQAAIHIKNDLNRLHIHLVEQHPSHILFHSNAKQDLIHYQLESLLTNTDCRILYLAEPDNKPELKKDQLDRVLFVSQPYTSFLLVDALLDQDEEPQQANDTEDAEAQADTKLHEGLKGKRVLVVEDIAVNQLVAQQILKMFGAHATLANNGKHCLDILKEQKDFDFILMDIQMPEMDGIEATKVIIGEQLAPNIPIIALTANVLIEDIQQYSKIGMKGYLPKPFEPENLYETLVNIE